MRTPKQPRISLVFLGLVFVFGLTLPRPAQAQQNWHAIVGAQSSDKGHQALAFLPDEFWIHAGDSITWSWRSDEVHTLTFLTVGQALPPFQGPGAGCPGFASAPASFDGSACLSTPPLAKGATFTVTFPTAGSYKFECLIHLVMSGTVHVLPSSAILPHDQQFYDAQAAAQREALLSDLAQDLHPVRNEGGDDGMSVAVLPRKTEVIAGVGEINATPGGYQTASVVRFLGGTITIHAGETVEWSNHDPLEPHTITFGYGSGGPVDEFDPTPNVTIDPDGVLHATITSPTDKVNSGFIEQPLEDEPGIPMNPIVNAQNPATNASNVALFNPTRFRVTFTQPGTYNYKCLLHDNLGMVGKVLVVP